MKIYFILLISLFISKDIYSQLSWYDDFIENESLIKRISYRKSFPRQDSSEVEFKLRSIWQIDRDKRQIIHRTNSDNNLQFVSEYDSNWNMVFIETIEFDSIRTSYAELFYDQEGKLIKSKGYYTSGVNSYKTDNPSTESTYFYNEQGRCYEKLEITFKENPNAKIDLKIKKIINSYDKEGRKIKEEVFELEDESNNFQLIDSRIFEYYPKSNKIKQRITKDHRWGKIDTKILKYEYDQSKLIKKVEWENEKLTYSWIYLYDNNLLSEQHIISEECNCLVEIEKYAYTKKQYSK